MNSLILVKPTLDMKDMAIDYKNEYLQYNEYELNVSALFGEYEYEQWLELIEKNSDKQAVRSDWVPASIFFAFRKSDNKLIGVVDIRHYLNKSLYTFGGHIGYGVRPSERRKGYATEILTKALDYAKSININRVMLTCFKDNDASRKTILKCNGVLERENTYLNGKVVQVYWINT